ncbi:glycine--tRNA ligase [Archaeoglobales archaeon]|nr:MAG: glycine--tRNA ligase [Archaeoglobales archaeon]
MTNIAEMLVRRGYLWQSFEIYGGMAGFVDYGPLGNGLRRNLEELWRKYFVINERAVEIDTPTIGIEDVFIASGHASSFTDVAIECEKCGKIFRADHYIKEKLGIETEETIDFVSEVLSTYDVRCECGGKFKEPENINLMFSTKIGPGRGKKGYLRPETAQGIFIDFKRLADYFREKLPFGVCQIGRAYRNEISPRQGVIRLREFNQAELEYFVHPGEKKHPNFQQYKDFSIKLVDKMDEEHNVSLGEAVERGIIAHELLAYFIGKTAEFLLEAGIKKDKLRFRQHKDDERAHYAVDCWDAETYTSYGWIEVVGIADRGDYDLTRHNQYSKEDLSIFIPYEESVKVRTKRFVPKMNLIGPKFRKQSKDVAEAIENYSGEILDGKIKVKIEGQEIEVDSSFFDVEEREEVVYGERVVPHVIEPSFGLDRITYAILEHSFDTDVVDGEKRRVLRLKRWMAPVQVAVLPLLSREPFLSKSDEISLKLKEAGFFTEKDDSGSIGRRYRRYDEIGTPFCVTIDHQTFEDSTVTIRDRDTTGQIRVSEKELESVLKELLESERDLKEFGVPFK